MNVRKPNLATLVATTTKNGNYLRVWKFTFNNIFQCNATQLKTF